VLADWGADVIKIENRQYPDGNRQSVGPNTVTQSFARGHRNKRSLGLNLRSESGKELFLDLVRQSDVVLSNFKPGTLDSLGLGCDVLMQANPRLVVADSSAFGATGPWSKRMGYGPLVRASTGLTPMWSYGDDSVGFSDAITIYPDHVAARIIALAVTALLLRRDHTGVGGTVSVAQTDVVLGQMADLMMSESIRPGSVQVEGNARAEDAPRGLFPCAGDDNWCVVDVQNYDQFRGLAEVIGNSDWLTLEAFGTAEGRLARRGAIEEAVRSWTLRLPPREAMRLLQEHGVPAGFMQRATEFDEDPQFVARGFLRLQDQPQFDEPLVTQDGEAVFSTMGRPRFGPAPIVGEHTYAVCSEVLGMTEAEIDDLIGRGTLEAPPTTTSDVS
jgi:crotonobetainyl-CoA:carnitine CoA-transferase CaiB-like acyl-CoA transferase